MLHLFIYHTQGACQPNSNFYKIQFFSGWSIKPELPHCQGQLLWSQEITGDHTDGLVYIDSRCNECYFNYVLQKPYSTGLAYIKMTRILHILMGILESEDGLF